MIGLLVASVLIFTTMWLLNLSNQRNIKLRQQERAATRRFLEGRR